MKMTKKVILLLFILFLGTISMNAQVTIGADNAPHPGAVLDLQSSKGLKLPTVALSDVNVFQLSSASDAATATSMMVYNTNEEIAGGQGSGIYVWNGSKWVFGLADSNDISIDFPPGPGTVSGNNGTYSIWCFTDTLDHICWMTQNSKEGIPSSAAYPEKVVGARGYYYSWGLAMGNSAKQACPPGGWRLPTKDELEALKDYVNDGTEYTADPTFKSLWIDSSVLAGGYFGSDWGNRNAYGYWWNSSAFCQRYGSTNGSMNGPTGTTIDRYLSVRCVKSN
jgi:uncharacterized protein (TIGR02145 family)